MPRLCFTITALRSQSTIRDFKHLLDKKLFQGIEIFYPYQLDELGMERYRDDIKYITENKDVEIVMHLPFGGEDNDLITNDNVMLRFFNAMDYASYFNVKKFTLHLGSTGIENYLDKAVSVLQKLCDYASHFDACIMVENMPSDSEVGSNLEELEYLFKNTDRKNLKLIYDTGHGHVSLKDTNKEIELLKKLKPYLCHIHVNDNDSTRDAHAKIGEGNIEFEKIFSSIKGYDGLYCLEILFEDYHDLMKYRNDLLEIFKKIE